MAGTPFARGMVSRRVLDWLEDPAQPAARYFALREFDGRAADDGEVVESLAAVPARGWAADLLAERADGGWWVDPKSLYRPKYLATNWRLLVLSDLGLTREDPRVRASCELWMRTHPLKGGGVGGFTASSARGHLCFTGNMARALVRFGYGDDERVRRSFEWLVETAHPKGGWSCFNDYWPSSRNLDSWEGLGAFAAYPRSKWTAPMHRVVEQAAEYYLDRELHRQGARYAPWYRFHYPVHYYYDLLVGLDLLTSLGYADDRRLRYALDLLRRRRRPDGRWNLDRVHPDLPAYAEAYFRRHPKQRPVAWGLEPAGTPSRMVTLRALRVLERIEHA